MAGQNKRKLGKLVVGAVLVGAAAYGIYRLAQKYLGAEKEAEGSGSDDEKVPVPEPQEEGIFEEEDSGAQAEGAAEESGRYTAVDLKQAADRAYTTIQHGTQDAVDRVMEAVGPKGAGVIEVACETAGEVSKVVADSAVRIYDILTEPEENTTSPEETESGAEESSAESDAEEPAAELGAEEPAAELGAEEPADESDTEEPAAESGAEEPAEVIEEEIAEAVDVTGFAEASEEAEAAPEESVEVIEEETIFDEEMPEEVPAPELITEESVEAAEEGVETQIDAVSAEVSEEAEAAAEESAEAAEEVVAEAGVIAEEVVDAAEDAVEKFFDDEEPSDP